MRGIGRVSRQRLLWAAVGVAFVLALATCIPALVGGAYLNAGALLLNRAMIHGPQYLADAVADLEIASRLEQCQGGERLGRAYLIQGNAAAAARTFERLVQRCDAGPLARLGLGQAYQSLGRRQEAIAQWTGLRGIAHYFYNCGYRNRIEKRFADSESCYRLASELDPDSPEVYLDWGHLYREQGDATQAIAMYRRTAALTPDPAKAYFYLGLAYRDAGHWQEAIGAFQTAIRLDPKYLDAYLQLGRAYWALGEFQTAVGWYRTARAVDPDSERPNLFLGRAALQQGELSQASEYLHLALAQNPQNAQVHYQLGRLYAQLDQPESAIEQFRQAVELNPRLVAAWQDLVRMLMARGQYQAAEMELQRALYLHPDNQVLQSQFQTLQTWLDGHH